MNKIYNIYLHTRLIGTTKLEKADAPMGVAFGQIDFIDIRDPYGFFKSYCEHKGIHFEAYEDERIIMTYTIPTLKVINKVGVEIIGVGNQISGMESGPFDLTILGIPYPFYGNEFLHHLKDYEERTKSVI